MKKLNISIKKDKDIYSILIGKKIINLLPNKIRNVCPNAKNIAIIIDKNVPKKIKNKILSSLKKYKIFKYELKPSEKIKNMNTVNFIVNKLISNNFKRNDLVISIGGGILGDISSFAASIFKRGLNFINVPTTFLAQVDSSIGGKTGVNTSFGKNLIGTFYQPRLVLIDVQFLLSLKKKEIICGYAEILKHGIINDKNFFNWLRLNSKKILIDKDLDKLSFAIKKSCEIKKNFVVKDYNEKSLRKSLNFGHTFAHAIEAGSKYSGSLNHGEAVLVGMMLAAQLSYRKKICSLKTVEELKSIYRSNNLDHYLKNKFRFKKIPSLLKFMKRDKKNEDNLISLILLKKIGQTTKPDSFKISEKALKKELKILSNFNF